MQKTYYTEQSFSLKSNWLFTFFISIHHLLATMLTEKRCVTCLYIDLWQIFQVVKGGFMPVNVVHYSAYCLSIPKGNGTLKCLYLLEMTQISLVGFGSRFLDSNRFHSGSKTRVVGVLCGFLVFCLIRGTEDLLWAGFVLGVGELIPEDLSFLSFFFWLVVTMEDYWVKE